MRITRRVALAGMLGLPSPSSAKDVPAALHDLARRATIYLLPVYEMYRARWQATVDEANPQRQKLNRFRHVAALPDHRSRSVSTPNRDALCSSAWLDLSAEPLFLTVPPVGDLYYDYAFLDLFTNNFAAVTHRLHGGRPPAHMIVGPGWKGDTPADVTLIRSPSNSAWLLGRLLVHEPDELVPLRILQARVLLETPDMRNERRILETGELMRFRTQAPPEPVADWPAPNPTDPFDILDVGMRALGESPLGERDRTFLEILIPLKLRPGRKFDQRAFTNVERRSIAAGIEQGHADVRAAAGRFDRTIDGWIYGQRQLEKPGDDYLHRAVTALAGLGTPTPAEAMHVACNFDAEGRPLSGGNRYELTFPADRLPPARASWSLSMYEVTPDGRAYFTDNPIDRYSIGDRTPGLVLASDGSLTLYLQRDRPAGERAANWLPSPAGPMRLILRVYQPRETMVEDLYRVPAVQRNSSP